MVRMVELADNFKAAIITMFSEVKYAHNKWKVWQSQQRKKWKFYNWKKCNSWSFKKKLNSSMEMMEEKEGKLEDILIDVLI